MCSREKIIAIHQPNYIPWLGYFYKIYISDIFVFLDDVQYSNEGMHNYHYVKTNQGRYRLKIPVKQKFGNLINEVQTREELGWRLKHIKTIECNYKKATYFDEVFSDYSGLIKDGGTSLVSLNSKIIQFFAEKLGLQTEFSYSSILDLKSVKELKVIGICKALNADVYFSGIGAKSYQDEQLFSSFNLELRYSNYKPFIYPQLWGEYTPNVSILDYLMNCGYDWQRVLDHQR